jgi:hypothetical protein
MKAAENLHLLAINLMYAIKKTVNVFFLTKQINIIKNKTYFILILFWKNWRPNWQKYATA